MDFSTKLKYGYKEIVALPKFEEDIIRLCSNMANKTVEIHGKDSVKNELDSDELINEDLNNLITYQIEIGGLKLLKDYDLIIDNEYVLSKRAAAIAFSIAFHLANCYKEIGARTRPTPCIYNNDALEILAERIVKHCYDLHINYRVEFSTLRFSDIDGLVSFYIGDIVYNNSEMGFKDFFKKKSIQDRANDIALQIEKKFNTKVIKCGAFDNTKEQFNSLAFNMVKPSNAENLFFFLLPVDDEKNLITKNYIENYRQLNDSSLFSLNGKLAAFEFQKNLIKSTQVKAFLQAETGKTVYDSGSMDISAYKGNENELVGIHDIEDAKYLFFRFYS
ncbi:hypothetical protein ACFSC6_12475 [Rufibacter sediminis]|uniref:Uncharacterized protein n=1 Tax=Rufibacter sediminis TaxID=2762756 RepID=A0ABR6VUZ4_9BACT|nr:hypothetical protein [Rufibacter sediminis]MBC3540697.1 hypothetical protein [Rufibacter sediminis]